MLRGQPSVVGAPLGFLANAAWRTGSQMSAPDVQAAYWASWADALNMIEQRLLRVAENIVTSLEDRHLEDVLVSCRTQADPWTTRVSSPVLLGRSSVGQTPAPGREFRAR